MSDRSNISWTSATWNPVRARRREDGKLGWHCEHVTTGCEFCYAEAMNKRMGTGFPFKPGHRKDIHLYLDDRTLMAPLHWHKSRMIFVCSMTDLFAEFVPAEWIHRIFSIMARCPHHTFQVLTKRPVRMQQYCSSRGGWLPNVWMGVSCERQEEADERIPILLNTPAAIRFISAEPLLAPIVLWQDNGEGLLRGPGVVVSGGMTATGTPSDPPEGYDDSYPGLDWVIAGGESGHHHRTMNLDWARSLRDQCQTADVAFFYKQGSGPRPGMFTELDGREHHEFPRRHSAGAFQGEQLI